MIKTPEELQDGAVAAQFQGDFDELLSSRITHSAFTEFVAHAHERAAASVLAACVYDIVRAEQVELEREIPGGKRSLLRAAERVATQTAELDRFYRDPTHAGELVLYAYDKIDDPTQRGRSIGLCLTTTNGANVEHRALEKDNSGRPDSYALVPHVQYGVSPVHITDGLADSWLQGSNNFYLYGESDHYREMFGIYFSLPYHRIREGVVWGLNSLIPSITIGRDSIVALYDTLLSDDHDKFYTENRYRRPSFALFRQACYLGDVSMGTMFDLADKKGMLSVWRTQMLDEEAITTVNKLLKLREDGRTVEDVDESKVDIFSTISKKSMDVDWLQLDMDAFIHRTQFHADQLAVGFEKRHIARALELQLQNEVRANWERRAHERYTTE